MADDVTVMPDAPEHDVSNSPEFSTNSLDTKLILYETDQTHFDIDIGLNDAQIKRFIVGHGPCGPNPNRPYPRDETKTTMFFKNNGAQNYFLPQGPI